MNDPLEKTETLYSADWLELKRRGRFEFISRKRCSGVVIIVPITDKNEIVLVEQYRHAVQSAVLELPAGLVGDVTGQEEEESVEAARRELLEETGFAAGRMEFLFTGPVAPGTMSELLSFYYADQLVRRHQGGGDDTENITVHVIPINQARIYLKTWQKQGGMIDPKVFIGLDQWQSRQ